MWTTLALMMLCVACEVQDLYDPNYKTENPMSDVQVDPDLDWSMTNSLPVTVKVNDEFGGEYFYLVNIYAGNPVVDASAVRIGGGVAKQGQNFSAEVPVAKGTPYIYIAQTDPRGRTAVRQYPVKERVNADFTPSTRAAQATSTRATGENVTLPTYSASDAAFTGATELKITGKFKWDPNTVYKVSSGKTVSITDNSLKTMEGKALYVQGTLNISSLELATDKPVIVLPGGKLNVTSGDISNKSFSMLVIMEEGTVNTPALKFSQSGEAYILGTLNVTKEDLVIFRDELDKNDPSIFYIGEKGHVTCEGDFTITNASPYVENNGTIDCNSMTSLNSGAEFYNNSVIKAESEADMTGLAVLVIDGGVLRSPVVNVSNIGNDPENGEMFVLSNGSLISGIGGPADILMEHATILTGGEGNPSLIQANNITGNGNIEGNLAVEASGNVPESITLTDVSLYEPGESPVSIHADDGTVITGNTGSTPTNPSFPITIPVGDVYTYMFEDLWPLYGDYDMNDVVFTLSNYKYTQEDATSISSLQFDITFQAVGASYPIGVALQLDESTPATIQSVEYTSAAIEDYATKYVRNYDIGANGVENGESAAVIPLVDEVHSLWGRSWFINTVNGRADANVDPITVSVKVNFTAAVSKEQADFANLNFFIMSNVELYPVNNANGVKRREVHLVNYQPTSKANTSMFGNHNDNTPWEDTGGDGEYTYISDEGLAWAIAVPAEIKWMSEWTRITAGYLQMENWMKGELNANLQPIQWWKSNGTNFDESKMFTPQAASVEQ
jgi:LruC domain-containing protein